MRRRLIRMLLTGGATLGTIATTRGSAEAAFTFTFQEQGADVVATGSGSINLAGFTKPPSKPIILDNSGVQAQTGLTGIAGIAKAFTGITGPRSLGPGGFMIASTGDGDTVAVNGADGVLGVPLAYVSGDALSNSMEFAGETFASLGLTAGTYSWTWGSGITADSLTVQIGPLPEPASLALFGIGLSGLGIVMRTRRA